MDITLGELLRRVGSLCKVAWLFGWLLVIAFSVPITMVVLKAMEGTCVDEWWIPGPDKGCRTNLPALLSLIFSDIVIFFVAFAPFNGWYIPDPPKKETSLPMLNR